MIKDIKGFEGEYEIDTKGNSYSCKFGKRRLLKPRKNTGGYLFVSLCKEGKVKQFMIHRLVAEAFLPNPNNLPQVNHKNEDKTDNRLSNLEWCDEKYNTNFGTGIKRRTEKQINGKTSKPVNQYTKEGILIASYPSTAEVHRQTGYSQGNISLCCLGRYKSAYGYIWKYSE